MPLLHSYHIVNLFVWIDDWLPPATVSPGRPAILGDSELVTILLWNAVCLHQKTLKDIHRHARLHLQTEFPCLPSYSAFVAHCHRVVPLMWQLLSSLLADRVPVKLLDSTMLPVCKLHRATRHKVAQRIAKFGKNHQGWHYGFKLHAAVTKTGSLSALVLTPANVYDAQVLPQLLNEHTKVAVGDSHYGAKVMGRIIWERYGTAIISPPHYKQRRKLAAPWQLKLLSWRSKIESVFDILKEHLQLVSSFPRSVHGYLVHYVRILLGYQILALATHE